MKIKYPSLLVLLLLTPLSNHAGETGAKEFLLDSPSFLNADRWRFGATTGAMFGVDAKFSKLGNWESPLNPIFGASGIDRTYLDGFNNIDSSGNDGDLTWNWGYTNSSQIDTTAGTISFSTFESTQSGSMTESNDPDFGLSFFGLYDMATADFGLVKGRQSRWGLKTGIGYQNIGISNGRSLSSNVLQNTDSFVLDGLIPPEAPYSGSFSGPGPLIGDAGTFSQTILPGGAQVIGSRELDVDLFLLSLGPYLEMPIAEKWTIIADAGLDVGIASGDYRYTSSTTLPGLGTQFSSGKKSETDFVAGFHAGLGVSYSLNSNWSLYSDLKYQYLSPVKFETNGSQAELQFDSAVSVNFGALFRF